MLNSNTVYRHIACGAPFSCSQFEPHITTIVRDRHVKTVFLYHAMRKSKTLKKKKKKKKNGELQRTSK